MGHRITQMYLLCPVCDAVDAAADTVAVLVVLGPRVGTLTAVRRQQSRLPPHVVNLTGLLLVHMFYKISLR